ncbi:MAG: hypothetical protein ABIA76_05220 [Candidatus Diapherotrites archaeon]
MQLFKLREGPWKELFTGSFQEYETAIYFNPDSVLLIFIFEKEKGKISGAVIETYKAFYLEGETEQFISTLPRNILMLYKHSEEANQKFMLLAGKPAYIEWIEEKVQAQVDEQLKKLNVSTKAIKDISKAYDLNLIELNNAEKEARDAFFSEPLMVPLTVTSKYPEKNTGPSNLFDEKEVMIGLSREGQKLIEPMSLLPTVLVTDGNEKERRNIMHILCENAMLAGSSVIVFDFNAEFNGLGQANPEPEKLINAKVESEPIGFPTKKMTPAKNLFIEFGLINPKALNEFIGTGKSKESELIEKEFNAKNPESLRQLIEELKKRPETEEFSDYEIHKAKRILQLISQHYQKTIGKNDLEELTKGWLQGMGKALLLELNESDEKTRQLLAYSVLKLLLNSFKGLGKTKKKKLIIAIPQANKLFPKEDATKMQKDLSLMLSELTEYGVGYFIETKTKIDIAMELNEKTEAKIGVIKENDIAVQLKNKKSYRAVLRPALSQIKE